MFLVKQNVPKNNQTKKGKKITVNSTQMALVVECQIAEIGVISLYHARAFLSALCTPGSADISKYIISDIAVC